MTDFPLYHHVPYDLRGTTLYPLNRLKAVFPDLYECERAKYAGREAVMAQIIPQLDCLWNDVLHLSPVHPSLIRDGILSAQLKWKPQRWFVLDPTALGFTKSNTLIYLHKLPWRDDRQPPTADFTPYDESALPLLRDLPAAARAYYQECSAKTENPLLFADVPHILHQGTIDISTAEIITV